MASNNNITQQGTTGRSGIGSGGNATDYTFKMFDTNKDIVYGKQKLKTFPLWSDSPSDADTNPESILDTFYTSSTEVAAWEGYYYWNIFGEDTATNLNAPPQFSIAFATTHSILLQHSDVEYQYAYPSRAIYGQFLNILEEKSITNTDGYFTKQDGIASSTYENMDVIYVISVARDRIKDGIELDTWQLNLSGSGGDSGSLLNLINETGSSSGVKVVNVIQGPLSDYAGTIGSATYGEPYGLFYPDRGVYVLDAVKIATHIGSGSVASYNPSAVTGAANYAPSASIDNFYGLITNGEYFRARTKENVQSTHYFCRILNNEFNFTTNPTWVSGSDYEIRNEFYGDPKTYITTVGLYDGEGENGQLVAVAKLSRPIAKDSESEALIKVQLQF